MNESPQTTLDDQLAEFYGRIELPPSTATEMLAYRDSPRLAVHQFLLVAGAAATVFLMVVISLSILGNAGPNIADLAMAEVAKNHRKGIAPEAVSSDYATVQEHLSKLHFSIEPPVGGIVDKFELIGGRYCKVQGVFAAQLKLRPRQGGPAATAFIVPAEGPLATIEKASTMIDGVRVRCERSGQRLVFLAEETPAK